MFAHPAPHHTTSSHHNRSINEDLLHLSGEPDDILINPEDIHFAERREG